MPEAHEPTLDVVVRPASEMTLKGHRTRTALRRRLKGNVKDALRRQGLQARVQSRFSRLVATVEVGEAGADAGRAAVREALSRVFGIGSYSFSLGRAAPQLEDIVRVGRDLFVERVRGRRYAVRCKRIGAQGFRSVDVERRLGAALDGPDTQVDLTDPDLTVALEVDRDGATFFEERLPGPGGLPLGAGGRALALMSGGFDSAVSAWMLMKRGIEVDFVFFRMGGEASERLALQVAKLLSDRWAAGTRPEFFGVDFGPVVDDLQRHARSGYWQIVLKRQMLRAADAVADAVERDAARVAEARGDGRPPLYVDALVTGESVGQVSSQTLANLRAIHTVAERPVLRPLVGMDKVEIMAQADEIGTGALSARVQEYCAITPGRAVTGTRATRVAHEERDLDANVLQRVVAERRRFALRALQPSDLVLPYLWTEGIPEGATLVDCRTDDARGAWRPEGARHVPAPELLRGTAELEKNRTYVLFCPLGTQSAHAAEVLQQLGYEAYSFRGGLPALRRHLEAQRPPAPAS